MRIPHFWEPEETVGEVWHDLSLSWGREPEHEAARVEQGAAAIAVGMMFRAAGGGAGVEIFPSAVTVSRARVTGKRRFAHEVLHVTRASFDGERLALPASIALFPARDLNRALYIWLAAVAAFVATPFAPPAGAFACDLAMLRVVARAEAATLAALPGLATMRARLGEALLAQRPSPSLPRVEAGLEAAIRALIARETLPVNALHAAIIAEDFSPADFATPEDYKPFRPVALWPLLAAPKSSEHSQGDDDPGAREAGAQQDAKKSLTARRHEADQANRRDSLIFHRFETILSWAEFLNINRAIEDEEEDNARRAAEDLDEITLARNTRRAKKKLLLHLDLSPRDVERARLTGEATYPEWDWKAGAYLPDHVRVEERVAEEKDDASLERPRTRRRIARVKRQFEALRPRRRIVRRQLDGFDLDLDEVIRARCDLRASGEASDRLYRAIRDDERDLAVCVLIDVSRSTESAVLGRPVIDIAREALVALIGGVEACGDRVAAYAFSSLKRERVMIEKVKGFDESDAATVRRRAMGLSPRFYTRMGAAIRHGSKLLAAQEAQRRLLLVLTDGKPNDLDHYDGRHGVEDTRRAVQEARRLGQAVFAVTVDALARDYIPHLFGANGFAIVPNAEKLVEALPEMYRHVAG